MDNDHEVHPDPDTPEQSPMSEELVALLRHRVATRYYDQPQVVDAIARGLLRGKRDLDENQA